METPDFAVFQNLDAKTGVDPESCSLKLASGDMDLVIVIFFDPCQRGTRSFCHVTFGLSSF
jgi:hypothetical protein